MGESTARYQRHGNLLSPRILGRIADMRILIAGAGGLGSHVLDLLVRLAPVDLEIWDPGILDEPDLNRQSLYVESDLGRTKVDAARDRLTAINGAATIDIRREAVTAESIFMREPDICFDCLDSFPARADLERALHRCSAIPPIVHGGVGGWFGQVALLREPEAGYSTLFGPDFESISTEKKDISPHVVAVVAALQVGEFLRYLREERGEDRSDTAHKLLSYDGLSGTVTQLEVRS